MNRPYRELFDNLSAPDRLRQEVWDLTTQERKARKAQFFPRKALIAAAVAAVLAATAVAANLGGVRDFFAAQWQQETGREISTNQLGLIDQLTQEIGVSDTDQGVTITLDSVTRGEGVLWLLLKIHGCDPYTDFHAKVSMDFSPELETAAFAYSFEGAALQEDGTQMVLLRYVPPLTGEKTFLSAYDVTLYLEDLRWNGTTAESGHWELRFSLDEMEPPNMLTLSRNLIVEAIPLEDPSEPVEVVFKNARITPTEIWLTRDRAETELRESSFWELQMKDGSTITHNGGASYDLPDGSVESVYYWRVPIDLSQVAALRYRDTVIPVQEQEELP